MECAFSMQDPFLSAGLEAEKTRKLNLNLTMALCGLALHNVKEKGSKGSLTNKKFSIGLGCDFKGFYPKT